MNIEALDEHTLLNPTWPEEWQTLPADTWVAYVDENNICSQHGYLKPRPILRNEIPEDAHFFPSKSVLMAWSLPLFFAGGIGVVAANARPEHCHPYFAACSRQIAVLSCHSTHCDEAYLMHWLRHYGRRALDDFFRERGNSQGRRLPRSALACYWLYLPHPALQKVVADYLDLKLRQATGQSQLTEQEISAEVWHQLELGLNY